jgi:signal peptidase I
MEQIPASEESRFKYAMHEVWDFLKVLLLAVVIVIPIRYFIAQPFIVKGASMEPTFEERNYLIVDEASYYFRDPLRGEVVVFRFPLDPSEYFIKRVIALPGERVRITGGKVYVAASRDAEFKEISESYLPQGLQTVGEVTQTMGANEYFVMGDNRTFSLDSRKWGALPRENITGRVVFRAWPIAKAGGVLVPGY